MAHHAPCTVIDLAKSGASLQVGSGYAASTYIEIARIVAELGTHAVIDLTNCAADTVRQVAAAGGRNVTIKL